MWNGIELNVSMIVVRLINIMLSEVAPFTDQWPVV